MDGDDLVRRLERLKHERRIWAVGLCGIIGVGKSSAIKRFSKTGLLQTILDSALTVASGGWPAAEKRPLICFVPEPTKEWREKGWLRTYYADQNEEAFWFQIQVFLSHVEAVKRVIYQAPPDRDLILIQERTIYDQRLFWEQQRTLGYKTATPRHHETYLGIWEHWRHFIPEPSVLLLFETTELQQTMHRVRARARAEELGVSYEADVITAAAAAGESIQEAGGVTLNYQEHLLQLHHEWYQVPFAHPPSAPEEGVPCIAINADSPFHTDDHHLAVLGYQIVEAILTHCLKK
jgi:deoxyadenosine/deoxycytidine kinase